MPQLRRLALFAILLLAACTATFAEAAVTRWPAQYLGGVAPDILNPKLAAKARELGFDSFALMHSGITRTPLWAAEHLTRQSLMNAKGLERHNDFHPEAQLPYSERSELGDYARSGFDRGHMAPSADMPSEQAQWQCFTLANMIPQNPDNNRHVWERIESTVRTLAKSRGELYVITGPLYIGSSVQRLNGRVFVPTNIYKIVYDPKAQRGAAYYVSNADGAAVQVLSISELEKLAGINFFPKLSAASKQAKLLLPDPMQHQSNY